MICVLVVLEHDRGTPHAASWEALTFGRDLAARLRIGVEALVMGSAGGGLAAKAAAQGAAVVRIAHHEILGDYGPEAWGETIARALESARVVVAAGTERGNEMMAQAAARLGLPMVANVTAADPGEPWRLTRLRWGGSLREEVELTAPVVAMTLAPHTVEPVSDPVPVVTRDLDVDLDAHLARSVIVDREVLTEGMTIATAPVVVGGGRGVGSVEGFGALEELAGLLGGVVGCSRVVTNYGWRPHTDQVGQTGTRIAPRLYIACGISGAIQHWVGAMASKAILAINTDREANMVVKADYAVIGDLREVVPALIGEIRRRHGE